VVSLGPQAEVLAKAAASMAAERTARKAMKEVAGMTVGVVGFPRMMHDENRRVPIDIKWPDISVGRIAVYWIIRTVSGRFASAKSAQQTQKQDCLP
jgi:hypothetical protein